MKKIFKTIVLSILCFALVIFCGNISNAEEAKVDEIQIYGEGILNNMNVGDYFDTKNAKNNTKFYYQGQHVIALNKFDASLLLFRQEQDRILDDSDYAFHAVITGEGVAISDDVKVLFYARVGEKEIIIDNKYITVSRSGNDSVVTIDMPYSYEYAKLSDYGSKRYPSSLEYDSETGISLEVYGQKKGMVEWEILDPSKPGKQGTTYTSIGDKKQVEFSFTQLNINNPDESYDGKKIRAVYTYLDNGVETKIIYMDPVTLHYVKPTYGDKKTLNINLTTSYPANTLIGEVKYKVEGEVNEQFARSSVQMNLDGKTTSSLSQKMTATDNLSAIITLHLKQEVFEQYIKDFGVSVNGKEVTILDRNANYYDYTLDIEVPFTFDGALDYATINSSANPSKGGNVTVSSTKVKVGETATVKASANEGYEFDYFMVDGVKNTNSNITIKAEKVGSINVVAYFKESLVPVAPVVPTDAYSKVSDWAKVEVDKAVDKGLEPDILKGKDLTYNINREEFACVAVKLYEALTGKKATVVNENPFIDTDSAEILKAYNVGITTGTSANTFEPGALITREQMATMMTRAIEKAKIDVSKKVDKKFDDDSNISDWANAGVYYMAGKEIIKGVGERSGYGAYCFGPKEQSTREQALLIAIRAVETLKK